MYAHHVFYPQRANNQKRSELYSFSHVPLSTFKDSTLAGGCTQSPIHSLPKLTNQNVDDDNSSDQHADSSSTNFYLVSNFRTAAGEVRLAVMKPSHS